MGTAHWAAKPLLYKGWCASLALQCGQGRSTQPVTDQGKGTLRCWGKALFFFCGGVRVHFQRVLQVADANSAGSWIKLDAASISLQHSLETAGQTQENHGSDMLILVSLLRSVSSARPRQQALKLDEHLLWHAGYKALECRHQHAVVYTCLVLHPKQPFSRPSTAATDTFLDISDAR
jgi:hypothetical protein